MGRRGQSSVEYVAVLGVVATLLAAALAAIAPTLGPGNPADSRVSPPNAGRAGVRRS
jgi:hypothetical protein